MRTTSGAWVRRARLAAADGMPIPTKQTVPFFSRRAASIVMISVGVYAIASGMGRLQLGDADFRGHEESGMVLRSEDMPAHPREKRIPVARNGIPLLAERVIAAVVAVRIARMRARGHTAHRGKHPMRKEARVLR